MRYRSLLLIAAFLTVGCSDSTSAPPSPIHYQLSVYHGPGWNPTGIATSANRGDTINVLVSLSDSITPGGSPATVRAICAQNLIIRHGSAVVASLPTPVTCPDSTYQLTLGLAFSANWDSRIFTWVIPNTLAPGTYTIVPQVLVQPTVVAWIELPIN